MRRSIFIAGLLLAAAALAGCGQKGPLVRPTPKPGAVPAPAHSPPPPPPAPTLPTPTPDDDGIG